MHKRHARLAENERDSASCHKSLPDKVLRLDYGGSIIPIGPRDNRRAFPESIAERGLTGSMIHKPFAHKNLRSCSLESTYVVSGQHRVREVRLEGSTRRRRRSQRAGPAAARREGMGSGAAGIHGSQANTVRISRTSAGFLGQEHPTGIVGPCAVAARHRETQSKGVLRPEQQGALNTLAHGPSARMSRPTP